MKLDWKMERPFCAVAVLIAALFSGVGPAHGQASGGQYVTKSDPKANRFRGLNILHQVNEILAAKYYDTDFRGLDMKAKFKAAEQAIRSQDNNWQIYRTIAQVLIDLQDSHTRFLPPDRKYRVEYGFSSTLIGDQCFVTAVKSGSDAEMKGLKPGDRIATIGDIPASRASFWVINYLIYGLDPQEQLKLSIVTPEGKPREILVASRFLSPKERNDERKKRIKDEQSKPFTCRSIGSDVVACKLRTFQVEKEAIDQMMKEAAASKKLILDLRGNGGGFVDTLAHFIGKFFASDVEIGTEIARGKRKGRLARGTENKAYNGELVVLIDSESASAAEVFARVMQIEKRGKVVGDTSAGAVMTSLGYGIRTALYGRTLEPQQPYQVSFISVSVGDLIMKDGNRLEGVGVSPDLPVGPTPMALLMRTDPVLAYAAELTGAPIQAEKAGEFNFLHPKTEDALENDSSEDEPSR